MDELENIERQLARLRFAKPPQWLKARAVMAGQSAYAEAMRRRQRFAIISIGAAAAVLVGVFGHYVVQTAGMLAPAAPPEAVRATPIDPFSGFMEMPDGALPYPAGVVRLSRTSVPLTTADLPKDAARPALPLDESEEEAAEPAEVNS
jgi:hypothetical protein